MFTQCQPRVSGIDCSHEHVVEDGREGTVVCVECGLVIEDFIFSTTYAQDGGKETTQSRRGGDKYLREQKELLFELSSRGLFPLKIVYETLTKFNEFSKQREESGQKKTFDFIALLAFSLFDTLCENHLTRTPKEICSFFGIDLNRMWKEEKNLNFLSSRQIGIQDFANRFCGVLQFEYFHTREIINICNQMYGMGDLNPQSIAVVVIYMYCKYFDCSLNLKQVCHNLNVSYGTINSILSKPPSLKDYIFKIISSSASSSISSSSTRNRIFKNNYWTSEKIVEEKKEKEKKKKQKRRDKKI